MRAVVVGGWAMLGGGYFGGAAEMFLIGGRSLVERKETLETMAEPDGGYGEFLRGRGGMNFVYSRILRLGFASRTKMPDDSRGAN
jgi:hypothetical protein